MAATIKVPGYQGNPPRQPSPSGSRDSKEFEDFFSEINDIEQGKDSDSPTEDDESKTPDEGENEASWLKDAGFAHLVTKFEEGKEIREDILQKETSSLTRAQAAAVKKRVDTLNATVRKKHRTSGKTDVRDVFSSQTDVNHQTDDSSVQNSEAQSGNWLRSTKRDMSIIKGRHTGGYSLSDGNNSVETGTVGGVETLSIQQKAGALVVTVPGEPYVVSDGDVSLNFALDELKPQQQSAKPGSLLPDETGLPNYVLVKDPLGVTRINDLGKHDLAKLRHLALIEMTSLFDNHNITFSRRKAKKKKVPTATLR